MVSFTPNLQIDNSPQYIGLSHAVSKNELGADKEGATAIAGFGDVLKDAVTGTDNTFKAIIDNAIHGSVDTEREGMTGALEGIANVPQANRVASYQPDNTTGDLTSSAQNVPKAVDAGLGQAANLISASGNGRFNPSYYEGRLDLIAKDLRNQYPGYRDYIDEKISSMTGGNPANKYMQELLTQINQGIQNKLTEKEKNLSSVRENAGIPGAPMAAQKIQSGEWGTPETVQWLSGYKGIEAKAAVMKAGLDVKKTGIEDKQVDARQNLNQLGDDIINHGFVTLNSGLGGRLSFDQVPGLLGRVASGDIHISEPDARQMAQSIDSYANTTRQTLLKYAHDSGAASVIPDSELQAWADSKIKPIQVMRDHIVNKEYGSAYMDHNIVQGITDNAGKGLMTSQNKTVRDFFQVSGAANKIGGPNSVVPLVQKFIGSLPADLGAIVGTNTLSIASQESVDGRQPLTLKQAVEQMQTAGVGQPDSKTPNAPGPRQQRKAFDSLLQLPQNLQDPNIPDAIKLNIIKGSYGDANKGLIGKFTDDTMVNGQLVKGQHGLFNDMTTPKTVDAIRQLDGKYPGSWDNFKRWAETEHADLFTNDLKTLNGLAEDSQKYKVAYDSDRHEFTAVPNQNYKGAGRAVDQFTYGQGGPFEFTLAKINSSMKNMAYIADKEGKDPNAYVLSTLRGAGVTADNPLAKAVLTATGKRSDNAPELEQLKPEAETTPLHEVIKTAESRNNYDSLYGSNSQAKLTDMSVGEVLALQKHHTDNGSPSSAAGAYQFLRPTLQSLIREGAVKTTDKFDQDTQDRLATSLMERRGLKDFKSGKISKEQFVNNLAKEFAGLPTTNGQSYYEGDGLNHARVRLPQVIASLSGL